MKKKLLLLVSAIILILVFYLIYKASIKDYKIQYKVSNFKVEEHYYKTKNHIYDITITNKKETNTYTLKHNFNKNKKIVKSIKRIKKDNLSCIIPIYKKDIDLNIYCNLDNKQVSVDYLLKTNNNSFKDIKKKIKKYKITFPTSSNVKKTFKKIDIYQDNIEDNLVYYIWDYKGIYILEKEKKAYQKILTYDLYDNLMSCIVNGNYLLWENNSVNGIDTIYSYNIKNNKLKKITLDKKISKDSYINGVIDNIVYLTDRKKKREYSFDLNTSNLATIDSDGMTYITYQNNIRKELSKSDFFKTDQLFIKKDYNKDLNKEGWINNNYFYYQDNNYIYKTSLSNINKPILLLELDNIKEWQIVGEEIIILSEDTIYAYNDKRGLRKIVEYKELNYNYENIYKVGEK